MGSAVNTSGTSTLRPESLLPREPQSNLACKHHDPALLHQFSAHLLMSHIPTLAASRMFRHMYRRHLPAQLNSIPHDYNMTSTCYLLVRLPIELRERIYTFALKVKSKEGFIPLTARFPKSFRQPPLLLTCRQIRREASPIFYQINAFRIFMRPLCFNADLLSKFFQQSGGEWWCNATDEYGLKRSFATEEKFLGLKVSNSSLVNWEGLLVWLKAFHEDRAPRPAVAHDRWSEEVLRAFDLVSRYGVLEWEELMWVLDVFRRESREAGQAGRVFWV